ncbi:hypothetical protein SAMN05216376_107283 [Mameliella alba]|uniref:hypothetical protein n=1 Tax=Mameliella TaxID=1434019 RepID=UPI000888CB99|nr:MULTISPECIES: hypothetical protein [Mameliella]MCR9272476.1 hypothetical protein [Paracoccaceae bacterium]OWV48806.1 hypothetical protein CDZ96_09435 [Mameliella alba]OWV61888.1 hypothetical protein CDZ98_05205 [Mameliella alba]PTR39381.1 hypothetical protein LX94_02560 [Mameliella alba]SDD32759.1 hypothetical protein SAMN05216376_107283 [Mameliella alba]
MTPEELVPRLAGIRIPESFARFGWQDALAAVALGLLAGLLLSALLRGLTARRLSPRDTARAAIARLASCETEVRIAGLAALLRANGGTLPKEMQEALYNPRAPVDPAALEAVVIAAARRRQRR